MNDKDTVTAEHSPTFPWWAQMHQSKQKQVRKTKKLRNTSTTTVFKENRALCTHCTERRCYPWQICPILPCYELQLIFKRLLHSFGLGGRLLLWDFCFVGLFLLVGFGCFLFLFFVFFIVIIILEVMRDEWQHTCFGPTHI